MLKHAKWARIRGGILPLGGLAALSLAMFADVLFSRADLVPSSPSCDVFTYFASARAFGFGELRQGRVALWNPHILSGSPHLGNFQSALFYPPNLIYLVLPLAKALTLDMALHVFLLGAFMYAWARYRDLGRPAAFFSGAVLMFSAPHCFHVFAGHLTMLDALAWTPLILLAADRLIDHPDPRWCLMGIFAATMQILAGLPQIVYCTAVAAAMYCAMRLFGCRRRRQSIATLAVMAVAPLYLSAVQLWTGIQTAAECARASGMPYPSAASYSFPPENLLMLLTPGFFGDFSRVPYWGREDYVWEVSLFVGITALVLAVYGAIHGRHTGRGRLALMVVLLMALALGKYTPVFALAYRWAPGFDFFRAPARFMFYVALFIALLAGIGLNLLAERNKATLRLAVATTLMAVALGAAGFGLAYAAARAPGSASWERLVEYLHADAKASWGTAQFLRTADFAAKGCLMACGAAVMLAALLRLSRRSSWAVHGIVVLGIAEVFLFAREHRDRFRLSDRVNPEIGDLFDSSQGRYRVLDLDARSNRVAAVGGYDILGYDPVMLTRYMDFVLDALEAQHGAYPGSLTKLEGLFRMLRLRYILPPRNSTRPTTETADPLPHFLLVRDYRVIPGRDAIFAALRAPSFDPWKTVILETTPDPPPGPATQGGAVTLLNDTTDSMELEVDAPDPAILLITDAYSKAWRVRPIGDNPQQHYELLPANYVLRAAPLAAGRHHIRIEYAPSLFPAGVCVSLVSALLFLGAVAWYARRPRTRAGAETAQSAE